MNPELSLSLSCHQWLRIFQRIDSPDGFKELEIGLASRITNFFNISGKLDEQRPISGINLEQAEFWDLRRKLDSLTVIVVNIWERF